MPQFDPNYRPAGSPRKPLGDPNRPAGSPRQSGGFFRSHFGSSRPPQQNPYQKPYPRREPGWDARAHRPPRPPRSRARWREYDHSFGYDRMPGYDPGLYDDAPGNAYFRSEPLPRDFERPPYAHPDPRPLPPHVRRRGCCGGCAAQAAAMLAAVGGLLVLLLHG